MSAQSQTRAGKTRERFNRDGAWLRRARHHYSLLLRSWCEEAKDPGVFRERVIRCYDRGREHGLWKMPLRHGAAHAILGHWKRADRETWWPWIHGDKRRGVAIMYPRDFAQWKRGKKKSRTA